MNQPRTRFDAVMDKRNAIENGEAAGEIADSMDVRKRFIEEMQSGKKTLAEIQAELSQIKRTAKKNGKLTRTQVWNRS